MKDIVKPNSASITYLFSLLVCVLSVALALEYEKLDFGRELVSRFERTLIRGDVDEMFFRITPSDYNYMPYVKITFESCEGSLNLFYSNCRKEARECDDGSGRWFPTYQNGARSLFSSYEHYGQPVLSPGKVATMGNMTYFFGVSAAKWPLYQDELRFRGTVYAYNSYEKGDMLIYKNDFRLQNEKGSNKITFQPIEICQAVDGAGLCTKYEQLPSYYLFFSVSLEDASNGMFNIGSPCGLEKIKAKQGFKEITQKNSFAYKNYVSEREYVISIGYVSDKNNPKRRLYDVAYQPMEWKKKKQKLYQKWIGLLSGVVSVGCIVGVLGAVGKIVYSKLCSRVRHTYHVDKNFSSSYYTRFNDQ